MRTPLFIPILGCIMIYCLVSCGNDTNASSDPSLKQDSIASKPIPVATGLDEEPLFRSTDSLQILYFDDPYGDSLRYTRFYKYVTVADSSFINRFIAQFNSAYVITDTIDKKCRSEGKVIVFAKGEPIKTVFFATGTYKNNLCKHLYFIKNGSFYFFPLVEGITTYFSDYKKISKSP